MTKRLLLVAAVVFAFSFAACKKDDDSPSSPTPTPTPPTRAQINMVVDPNPIQPNFEGDGWYRFKVNLGFDESAGIGFQISTIRVTITSGATGNTVLDDIAALSATLGRVEAYGNKILQYTSPKYLMAGGTSAGTISFVVSIIDDRSNAITITGQATMLVHGEPHRLP